jgi:LacI family transcriptional regulator
LKKPTAKLADVARLAQVSCATVSRALSQPRMVSVATLKRVEDAAQSLRYVPHGAASALRSRRTHTIGAVIPTLDNALYAHATHALQKAFRERDYTLLLACHEFDLKAEIKVTRSLIERGVDALVLVGAEHDAALFTLLADFGIPYVLTWALDTSGRHPSVGFDNRVAALRVANYLVDIGHREIAMISGVIAGNDRARERLAGVRAALAAHSIALPPERVIERPYSLAAGRTAMQALLKLAPRPTAVVCANDVLAMGAVIECRAQGVEVPAAMSITGFDDMEAASILVPALTTVRIPMRELGEAAARQVLARLDGEAGARVTELAVDLIVRGTTAPPAGRANT